MDNYKPTFGIEPTDKYKKATQDLLQALNSVSQLSLPQRQRLAKEFFGATNVATIYSILQQYFEQNQN